MKWTREELLPESSHEPAASMHVQPASALPTGDNDWLLPRISRRFIPAVGSHLKLGYNQWP